ncbi:MAG: DUF21 domain-containing protein [Gemmatimonas sp.]|nr:DUF21 domain-containing protein [Gemmatimonas sp.]
MNEGWVGFQALLILALIFLNGIFAMSEIAVVSSRKTKLRQLADEGDLGAKRALDLAETPTHFLSTVQVGITLIGVFAGAYGGASIAGELDEYFQARPRLAGYSAQIALAIVVAFITYFTLVLGELVPKRIALSSPERIAALIARPMQLLSVIASPLVKVLSLSTDGLLKLLPIRMSGETPVTEEELTLLLEAGADAGVFEEEEQELVERVFWLGDQLIGALLTPRHRIAWLDLRDSTEAHREEIVRRRFSHYLVCDGDVDHVLGMVRVKDLLAELLAGKPLDLEEAIRKPLFVPVNLRALRLLEMFRESGVHLAVVVDEYGGVEGLITLSDVLEEIAGDLSVELEPRIVSRGDGSWLVDGSLPMTEFWAGLNLEDRRHEGRFGYQTVAGFVMTQLGRVPLSGDAFEVHGLRFEVVDMDGYRIDKVLVGPVRSQSTEPVDAD